MKKLITAILVIIFTFITIPLPIESEIVHVNPIVSQPDIKSEPLDKSITKEENNNYKMFATAYDLSVQSCSKSYSNPSRGVTRSGYNLTNKTHKQAYTIASNRFTMGTKLKLTFPSTHKQYDGIYTVRDSGNFRENTLDVYIGDFGEKVGKETIKFGRVDVQVEVIK